MDNQKKAVIIGAGPAGLTAAYELLAKTSIKPIVIEQSESMGGLSKTVFYKGNRIDIGGHRFFSKSDRVMEWWLNVLPLQRLSDSETVTYHGQSRTVSAAQGPDPKHEDRVMLVRNRKSRIYFLRKFFDYPIRLNFDTLKNLGFTRASRILISYLRSTFFPIRNEISLEDFFINRFGMELYTTFFKSYTEKVWGMPCSKINAEWGAQRIKGLSIRKVIGHVLQKLTGLGKSLEQKNLETSLIEKFMYPKYGPGQLWEEVASKIKAMGGEIKTELTVDKVRLNGNRVTAVEATDTRSGEKSVFHGDYFFSTMAIKDLIRAFDIRMPKNIVEISEGLPYRNMITVGLLLKSLRIQRDGKPIHDNWIYIQEPEVKVGRMQIFNNWSPYLLSDPKTVWIGLEYFCGEDDSLWTMSDEKLIAFAIDEMSTIGILDKNMVLDATVIRSSKTYPAYFGTYNRFEELKTFLNQFENLFPIGRNGMHRYNNQDHSMLTAMLAVENIADGITSKDNLWAVNTEMEYLEEKKSDKTR